MKIITTMAMALVGISAYAQRFSLERSDSPNAESVQVTRIYSDSLCSSFHISLKEEVPPHFHAAHTEHVQILSGHGIMQLGDSTFKIVPGDLVSIPKGTVHGVIVTSNVSLQLISIQAPYFDGSDRIFIPDDQH